MKCERNINDHHNLEVVTLLFVSDDVSKIVSIVNHLKIDFGKDVMVEVCIHSALTCYKARVRGLNFVGTPISKAIPNQVYGVLLYCTCVLV